MRQDYGFYVFAEMLRLRIGSQAFFQGLDRLSERQKNQRVSTEQIQKELEVVSGQALDSFFDFWIHGGRIPSLKVTTRAEESETEPYFFGCIESDIPFGIFEVPIRIHQGNRATDAIIKVVNGQGSFLVPKADRKTKVEVDPLGLILSFERSVNNVRTVTACKKDPKRTEKK